MDPSIQFLSDTFDFVMAELQKLGDKSELLPLEQRTFLLVYSSQGVIDNGGLQYFFECNWNDLRPYQDICDAYRRIGASEAAEQLEQAVGMFQFPNPHLDADRRNAAMEQLWADENSGFADSDWHLCGNEQVWQNLEQYVKRHQKAFELIGRQ